MIAAALVALPATLARTDEHTAAIIVDRSVLGVFPDESVDFRLGSAISDNIFKLDEANQLAIDRSVVGVLADETLSVTQGSLAVVVPRGRAQPQRGDAGLLQLAAVLRGRDARRVGAAASQGLSGETGEDALDDIAAADLVGDDQLGALSGVIGEDGEVISAPRHDGGSSAAMASLSGGLSGNRLGSPPDATGLSPATPPNESGGADEAGDGERIMPIRFQVARLSALDKITARTRQFDVAVGQNFKFGSISGTVRSCQAMPPTEPPHAGAFLQISEENRAENRVRVRALYSGWVFAESPGLTGLEHPVYDIWLRSCAQPLTANEEGEQP